MRVLVACEESQAVCKEFRKLGHEAYSCDLQECSGGHPEWHFHEDVFEVIKREKKFDLLIGHPPCTVLSNAGIRWFNIERYGQKALDRIEQRKEAFEFVMRLWNCGVEKICIENPVGYLNSKFRKPNQTIHPYYFGDSDLKRTCLWLKNLPRLNGLQEVAADEKSFMPIPTVIHVRKPSKYYKGGEEKKRYFTEAGSRDAKIRSKTFIGIAKAMALQWGRL